MERPFNFRIEMEWNWDKLKLYTATSKQELNELYHAYKKQYLEAERDKRKQLGYLAKNGKSILTEAKSDWGNLTLVKKNREADLKSDKAHGVWQEAWEQPGELLARMDYEGYLAALMKSKGRAPEKYVSHSIRCPML